MKTSRNLLFCRLPSGEVHLCGLASPVTESKEWVANMKLQHPENVYWFQPTSEPLPAEGFIMPPSTKVTEIGFTVG